MSGSINLNIDVLKALQYAKAQEDRALDSVPELTELGLLTNEEADAFRQLCHKSIASINQQIKDEEAKRQGSCSH